MVDDDALARQVVANCIARTPFLQLVGSCNSANEALMELRTQSIDLLLLDIAMPGLSGLDLLRAVPDAPPTIFITSATASVRNAFDVQVVDYLRKPITYGRFLEAAELAWTMLQVLGPTAGPDMPPHTSPEHAYVKTIPSGFTCLCYADVRYAEALENAVQLHLPDGRLLRLPGSLHAVEGRFPAERFARIHRAFLVSLAAIKAVEEHAVELTDGRLLPVGAAYRAALVARLSRF